MKKTHLIIIATILLTAGIIISIGFASNKSYVFPESIKGITGETAKFQHTIGSEDPTVLEAYIGDGLYEDDRYLYAVDRKEGYIKFLKLKHSEDWDAIVKDTEQSLSEEEVSNLAIRHTRDILGTYLNNKSELSTIVKDGEYYSIEIIEYLNGKPTGISVPTIMISHNGQVLIAMFRVARANSNKTPISKEDAENTAIEAFISWSQNPVESVKVSREEQSLLRTNQKGRMEWKVYLSFVDPNLPSLERTAMVRLDAITGKLIEVMLSA
ncbi:MAG: hypothetical protein IJM90_01570 [Firmicutes bacterium]|nr:hypothetical protein [Bacillota bacterium]